MNRPLNVDTDQDPENEAESHSVVLFPFSPAVRRSLKPKSWKRSGGCNLRTFLTNDDDQDFRKTKMAIADKCGVAINLRNQRNMRPGSATERGEQGAVYRLTLLLSLGRLTQCEQRAPNRNDMDRLYGPVRLIVYREPPTP
ncbi:hypothetical protein RvY_02282 [Ramazzottius varieornatus]|uniref:Uncharacterized protein n=1 Tax=Ramazzottius varieornatus TaxID=947166 RepID=A0A1D1UJZ1_RAMVA|nr:hypothetical protein RvY_02282 [Ramazzottius varieornatus]